MYEVRRGKFKIPIGINSGTPKKETSSGGGAKAEFKYKEDKAINIKMGKIKMTIPFLVEKDLLKFKSLVSKESVKITAEVLKVLENIFLEIQADPNKSFFTKVDAKKDYDTIGKVAFFLEGVLKRD
jgi:hypothetical protein